MAAFTQAVVEYWYLSIAFVAVSALTVFVCIKASKASKKARAERNEIISRLKYENRTRAEFSNLTEEMIAAAAPKKLFDGIALNLQSKLEKESDMNAAYEKLTQPQKYIYALYYVSVDGARKLSEFFKMNGKPLTPAAGEAVRLILGCKAWELYKKEYDMFDEDNEEISLSRSVTDKYDAEFAAEMPAGNICVLAADYIKQNAAGFIQQ